METTTTVHKPDGGSKCERCGCPLLSDAHYCGRCGEPVGGAQYPLQASDRSRLVALLLCSLLGYLGVHRFYVGKFGTGVLWLLTGGLFSIGWIIDLVLIVTGNFRDHWGLRLIYWDEPLQ